MQKAPFDEKYQGCLIRVHNIALTTDFWDMNSKEDVFSIPYTRIGIYGAKTTDFIGDNEVTANVTLILRNQSDYSNVIILIGIFSINASDKDMTRERMFLIMSQYLFGQCKDYAKNNNIVGSDGKEFLLPVNRYADDKFINYVGWE